MIPDANMFNTNIWNSQLAPASVTNPEPSLREIASHIACTDQDILLGLAAGVGHQSGLVQC